MKNNIILTLLIVGTVLPIKVQALTGNMKLTCDNTTVLPGTNITCTLTGDSFSEKISSFHGELNLGSNLKLESIEEDSSWEGSADGGIIDLYTDVNKSGDINFVTFTVKADSDISNIDNNVSIDNIKIGSAEFIEYDFANVSTSIKITSNDNDGNNGEDNPGSEPEDDKENNPGNKPEDDKENESGNQPGNDQEQKPEEDKENESDNNNNDNNNNNNYENNITNPTTGNSTNIAVIIFIILVSAATMIIVYKKNKNVI